MKEEQKTNVLCAALLLFVISAFVVLKSARDALFLADFSPRLLPYLMAATTLAGAAFALVYLGLLKRYSLSSAIRFSFVVFLAGTLLLWSWIIAHPHPATILLYLWTGIFGTLAPVQCWSLITERMLARQARRSFQVIGAGSVLGGTTGGLLARWTTGMGNAPTLLPVAAVLIGIALALAHILSLRAPAAAEPRPVAAQPPRKRFLYTLLLFVASTTIVAGFVDFQFKVIAQEQIKTANGLASFFGTFYAYSGAATFLFQILFLAPMMRFLPLTSTLAVLPAALLLGNGFLLLSGSLSVAVLLKASEQLFRNSVDRSSMELLYMAIPENVKVRAKSLIDTVGVRGTELFCAILLILLFSVGKQPVSSLAMAGMIMSFVSILIIIVLGQEYARALQNAVHRESLRFSNIRSNVFTTDFYTLLPEVVQGAGKETILDLLEILATNKKLTPHLELLLQHTEPEVRLKSLEILFSRSEDYTSRVSPMLFDSDRRVRLEAVHYLNSRKTPEASAAVRRLMEDPEPEIRAVVWAASLIDGEEADQLAAYEKLLQMLNEGSTQVRLEVARTLGDTGASQRAEQLLRKLLRDPSPEVQRAALRSIGRSTPPELAADLMNLLDESPLSAEIREALACYGESLIPALQKMLDDRQKSHDQKKLIVKIARSIGGGQAAEMLMRTVRGPDLPLRFAALKALNRLKKNGALNVDNAELESLLEQELESLNVELQREAYIRPSPGTLIQSVLHQRRTWAQERIFRVLELLYESATIQNAYQAFRSGDPRQSDKAVEWLDTTLRPEHRKEILHFLDPRPAVPVASPRRARKSILLGYIGGGDQLPAAALIVELEQNELTEWYPEILQVLKLVPGLTLLEETLNWKYQTMKGEPARRNPLTTVQKLESLGRIDIFAELGPHELLLLANQSSEVELQAGEIAVTEGSRADSIFCLVRGEIERSSRSRPLDVLQPGESFGVLSSLTTKPHFYTARAVSPVLCLKIPNHSFQEIMEDYPVIALGIFRVVTEKFQALLQRVGELESKLGK